MKFFTQINPENIATLPSLGKYKMFIFEKKPEDDEETDFFFEYGQILLDEDEVHLMFNPLLGTTSAFNNESLDSLLEEWHVFWAEYKALTTYKAGKVVIVPNGESGD